jgi:hypothetical protein
MLGGCRFFFMHVKYTKHARTWRVVTYLAYLKKAYFLTCPLWLFLLFRNVEHAFENAVFVFGVFGVLQRTWRVATYLTYLTKKRHPLFLFDCLIVLPVFTGNCSYRHLPEATGIVSGSERFEGNRPDSLANPFATLSL